MSQTENERRAKIPESPPQRKCLGAFDVILGLRGGLIPRMLPGILLAPPLDKPWVSLLKTGDKNRQRHGGNLIHRPSTPSGGLVPKVERVPSHWDNEDLGFAWSYPQASSSS